MERSLPNSLFPERGAGTMYHTTCFSEKLFTIRCFFEAQKNEIKEMDL